MFDTSMSPKWLYGFIMAIHIYRYDSIKFVKRCNVNIFSDKTWPQMYINIVDIYQWMTSMMVKAFVHHRHAVCFHLGNSNRKFFVSGKCYSFRNVALNAFINFWGSRCTCFGSNEIKDELKLYLFDYQCRPYIMYNLGILRFWNRIFRYRNIPLKPICDNSYLMICLRFHFVLYNFPSLTCI